MFKYLGAAFVCAVTLLAVGTPAAAAAGWAAADLTALAGAPNAVASRIVGYTTNLTGQGPVARVVYRTTGSHVQELSVSGAGGSWASADLTQLTGAPLSSGTPFGYTTSLTGQGPVARVVFRVSGGHVYELGVGGAGQSWKAANLTQLTGAPLAAGDPVGYTTSLTGQGPVARVVYRTSSGHVQELSVGAVGGSWASADLTQLAGAPAATNGPFAYTTNLTGQGPVARVIYRTGSGHVQELSVGAAGGSWASADLTQLTGAPLISGTPIGYTTNLTGQGTVARVVYQTGSGHMQELNVGGAGQSWNSADLTQITGAPSASGGPFGYTTSLTGQGAVARVIYVTSGLHVEELSVA